MLFENKTNSQILANLNVPEEVLKRKYMTNPGWGLDLLEALHTIISPEEIALKKDELKITDTQLTRLFMWLKFNCVLKDYANAVQLGYHFSMIGLIDNNQYGVLTKIRRYVSNWRVDVDSNGELIYDKLSWLYDPEVLLENEDSKLFIRKAIKTGSSGPGQDQRYAKDQDSFYENNLFAMKKSNSIWRKATEEEQNEMLNAIEIIKMLSK